MHAYLRNKKNEPLNFFKLLHRLDKKGTLSQARIFSATKLGFPASDVQSIQIHDQAIEIKATFFGLYGVSSILPPFMNALALENSVSGEAIRSLLDIFQKRLYLLKYQVWKQGHSPLFMDSWHTAYAKLLRSIAGDRLPETARSPAYAVAGFLNKKVLSTLNLAKICQILTGFFVEVEENVLKWVPHQKKLNECQLGENALLGRRYLENRSLFLIKINCVVVANVQKLSGNKACIEHLKLIIQSCLDPSTRYELFLEAGQGFVQMCLGDKIGGLGLGRTLGYLSKEKKFSIRI